MYGVMVAKMSGSGWWVVAVGWVPGAEVYGAERPVFGLCLVTRP